MDFRKILFRAKQFGGARLAMAYFKLGVGHVVIWNVLLLLLGFKSRDEAYAAISRAANKILQTRYRSFILEKKCYYDSIPLEQTRSKKVWTSWLQGFDNAPVLVKRCAESMKKFLTDRDVLFLSLDDFDKYVKLPEDIVKKFKEGKIPPALFSDLLRLKLLIEHGGTWMDATILCTSGGTKYPTEILDCNLFVYQVVVPGNNEFKGIKGISNWFLTSCRNNRILLILFDLLIQYWRDYDCTLDYYIFHDFFCTIAAYYPEEIAAMPSKDRLVPLELMNRMGDKYDAVWMKELTDRTCFHKLNYRISEKVQNDKANFYNAVIEAQFLYNPMK